jgi:two-component system cell cycle response regulator
MEVTSNTVLIIEDNESISKIFSFLLKKEGYSIVFCKTGKEAFNWIDNHLPIIVICDISLPDMNGEEVLAYIKKLEHTVDLPVLAVTAIARAGDKEKFLNMGFTGYISKPINTATFVSEIQKYLKK